MSGWCRGRAATGVRIQVRARAGGQANQYKKTCSFANQEDDEKAKAFKDHESKGLSFGSYLTESEGGNRVVVVVDSSPESKGALNWVLSHTVGNQDTIILLHVVKQDMKADAESTRIARDLLRASKSMCQQKRPEVQVEMLIQDGKGKEKAAVIVEEAKSLKASLLVLGQQKKSILSHLRIFRARKRTRSRVVDYCIQYATCMTIAVRRKHRKYGGYSITTKRHKNFWLLA